MGSIERAIRREVTINQLGSDRRPSVGSTPPESLHCEPLSTKEGMFFWALFACESGPPTSHVHLSGLGIPVGALLCPNVREVKRQHVYAAPSAPWTALLVSATLAQFSFMSRIPSHPLYLTRTKIIRPSSGHISISHLLYVIQIVHATKCRHSRTRRRSNSFRQSAN